MAALLGTMPQAFANEPPAGTITVDRQLVMTGARPLIGCEITRPEKSVDENRHLPDTTGQPILVRVTAETLAALQARDPMIRLVGSEEQAGLRTPQEQPSIIRQSTVLHDGRNWTLIPNGALLVMPAAMQAHLNAKPVGTLMPWREFLAKNRAWLATHEVTFDQAAGNEELPAGEISHGSSQDKVVVAVQQNGPISVRVSSGKDTLTKR
jgi:hypothetical protein